MTKDFVLHMLRRDNTRFTMHYNQHTSQLKNEDGTHLKRILILLNNGKRFSKQARSIQPRKYLILHG